MKYLHKCKTIEELKRTYFKYAKSFHPDNGGSDILMKELNAEFAFMQPKLKNIHEFKNDNTEQNSNTENYSKFTKKDNKIYTDETPEMFINIVDSLLRLDGIEIEIRGEWLWLSGNTYYHKETLKILGCRYSKGRRQWYWTVSPYIRKHSKMSVEDMRSYFGSKYIKRDDKLQLKG